MRPSLFCVYLLCLLGQMNFVVMAQETPAIKVRKESDLARLFLDNTNYSLIVMDRFGNPRENRVLHYKLHVKLRRDVKVFEGHSNSLTPDMVQFLNGLGEATKIFVTDIQAEEEGGHLANLPDLIETWFPNCSNCEPTKKRGRR